MNTSHTLDNVLAFPRERTRAPGMGPLATALDVRDLGAVSRHLVVAYALLAELGQPPQAIAEAMLGATVNFHDAYDLAADLPERLRTLASAIETGNGRAMADAPAGVA